MRTTTTDPAVWIGCLACYNNGTLTGDWYEGASAGEVTPAQIHGGPTTHEELWCFDYEGLPISGEVSPQEAARIAQTIAEVDEHQRDAFRAWIANDSYIIDGDNRPDTGHFEECYAGEWDSFEDYAHNFADDIGLLGDVPEEVARYFNWSSWIADLQHDYTVLDAPHGGVFVFHNH